MTAYTEDGTLTTATKTWDGEAVDVTVDATVPSGTSVDAVVYQDESGGKTADSQESFSVSDGTNTYSLSSFTWSTGSSWWIEFTLYSSSYGSDTPSVNSATLTIDDVTTPSAPSNLTASVSEDDITLDWDPASWNGELGHYDLYRGQSPGSHPVHVAQISSGTTTYTDSGLTDGVQYYYVVDATNSAGTSADSNEASETAYLPAITDLTTPDVRATEVDLSWSNPEDNATEKRVYVRRTGTDDDATYERTGVDLGADGHSNRIMVDPVPTPLINSSRFTVIVKANSENPSLNTRVVNFGSKNANTGGFVLGMDTDGSFRGFTDSGDGSWNAISDTSDLISGGVRTFGLSHDGTTLSSYVDGANTANVDGGYVPETDSPALSIGNRADDLTEPHPGTLYVVYLYDRALTESEHSTIATGGFVSNGLIGYWPLDLIRSGTTPDLSPYPNDGTVNGPTLTGPTVQLKNTLSATATSDTVTGLKTGEEYESYVHTLTSDNEVRSQ